MSLRLVSESEPSSDIAAAARGFADAIDAGKINVGRAILIAVIDGKMEFTCFGESPSISEGIGYLELAKAKIIEGAWTCAS